MSSENKKNPSTKNQSAPLALFDFFVVRAPLLPMDHWRTISSNFAGPTDLKALIKSSPMIERALFAGNPSLYAAVENSAELAQKSKTGEKEYEKIQEKVLRLLLRMSSRSTPFGLYAGLAIGKWADTSSISIAETGVRTRTRIDMELLSKLSLGLEKSLLKHLKLVANPTIHLRAGKAYLLETAPLLDEKQVDGSWMEATEEVEIILSLAKEPISYADLVQGLSEASDIDEQDIHTLLEYLLDTSYLLTNLRPNTFDADACSRLLGILKEIPEAKDLFEKLTQISRELDQCNQSNGGFELEKYKSVSKSAEALQETKSGNALQTDMELTLGSNTLGKKLQEDLSRLAELLMRISTRPKSQSSLHSYKEKFLSAYETREVPLLELLNQDFGLGFPDYLSYSEPGTFAIDLKRQEAIDEVIYEAIRDQKLEVVLDSQFIERIAAPLEGFPYPASGEVWATLLSGSPQEIDNGNYLISDASVIPGAGRNLGRFVDMLGKNARDALKAIAEAEQKNDPDFIYAEMRSLPRQMRLANVCTVPLNRDFHIVLDSWPGFDNDKDRAGSIALDDLVVGMNNDRFYLRSIKHGSKIKVRASSMANSLFRTQIARFLVSLSEDGAEWAGRLPLGSAIMAPFIPRLRFEKYILSPAQWHLRMEKNRDHFSNRSSFQSWLKDWRNRWFVPRFVQLRELDNFLLLDLEDEAHRELLRNELLNTKNSKINIQEAFCEDEHLWAQGPGGKFATELVFPFILDKTAIQSFEKNAGKDSGKATAKAAEKTSNNDSIESAQSTEKRRRNATFAEAISFENRFVIPGSNWLYYKLYCGKNLQDEILTSSIFDLIQDSEKEGLFRSWFFIKYGDPFPHLRIRFNGDAAALQNGLNPRFLQLARELFENGISPKVVIDTYDREVERYGGLEAMELAEQLFAADSRAAVRLLALESEEEFSLERINISALSIEILLDGLGFDTTQRTEWYKKFTSGRVETSDEYRKRKDDLFTLFSASAEWKPGRNNGAEGNGQSNPNDKVYAILHERSRVLKIIGSRYAELEKDGKLVSDFPQICNSLVHMLCNRYLGTDLSEEKRARALAYRAHEAVANRSSSKALVQETI